MHPHLLLHQIHSLWRPDKPGPWGGGSLAVLRPTVSDGLPLTKRRIGPLTSKYPLVRKSELIQNLCLDLFRTSISAADQDAYP